MNIIQCRYVYILYIVYYYIIIISIYMYINKMHILGNILGVYQ